MAKLLLQLHGNGLDYSRLTAVERLVRKGRKFIGYGSNDVRTGSMPEIPVGRNKLPVNGTYTIPEGEHTDTEVYQEITTMDGMSVSPGGNEIVINCAGKYMTGDIVIEATANLKPDTIKYGVVVGEGEGAITGTCQGFFD